MSEKPKVCIDCKARAEANGTPIPKRDAPHQGPRCYTCWNAKKRERKAASRAKRWENVYSITAEQYNALYEAQGGHCAICGIGRGISRALHVDHDHSCCDGPTSCGKCVRGLLDSPCNVFLGQIRDSVEAAQRLLDYLQNPPARAVLDNWNEE